MLWYQCWTYWSGAGCLKLVKYPRLSSSQSGNSSLIVYCFRKKKSLNRHMIGSTIFRTFYTSVHWCFLASQIFSGCFFFGTIMEQYRLAGTSIIVCWGVLCVPLVNRCSPNLACEIALHISFRLGILSILKDETNRFKQSMLLYTKWIREPTFLRIYWNWMNIKRHNLSTKFEKNVNLYMQCSSLKYFF